MRKSLPALCLNLFLAVALLSSSAYVFYDARVYEQEYDAWYDNIHRGDQALSPLFDSTEIGVLTLRNEHGEWVTYHTWSDSPELLEILLDTCNRYDVGRVVVGQHVCTGGSITWVTVDYGFLTQLASQSRWSPAVAASDLAGEASESDNPNASAVSLHSVATGPRPVSRGFKDLAHNFVYGLSQRIMLRAGWGPFTGAFCLFIGLLILGIIFATNASRIYYRRHFRQPVYYADFNKPLH